MNYEDIRERLTSEINTEWLAAYPSNKIVFENQPMPDMEQEREMFCGIRIRHDDSYQSAMVGTASPNRMEGAVEFDIYVLKSSGSKSATEVFDFFDNLLKLRTISGIVLKVPRRVYSFEAVGWYVISGIAPFYADSFTT